MAIRIDRITGQALWARLKPLLRSAETIARHDRTVCVLVRLFAVVLGLFAIAWGATTFPTFWSELSLARTADAIVDRAAFKPGSLDPLVPALDQIEKSGYCWPEAVRSATIIRLRLAEDAIGGGENDAIDAHLSNLQAAIGRSLACAPSDSFLWMILVWLDQTRRGFQPEQLTYLRLSYRLGPHEGWIAERRNRLALSMFDRLPPDLIQAAVQEFASIVSNQFYSDAVSILTGPGWPIHDQLLASLKDVDRQQRAELAKELYSAGYDVAVPGVAPPDLPLGRPF